MHYEVAPDVLGREEPPIAVIACKLFISLIFNCSATSVDFKMVNYLLSRVKYFITDFTL